MNSSKVMIGIALGAAVGAAFGVLYAPSKGTATRRRIARKSTDYAEEVKDKFNEYIDVLSDEYQSVRDGALDWVDKRK